MSSSSSCAGTTTATRLPSSMGERYAAMRREATRAATESHASAATMPRIRPITAATTTELRRLRAVTGDRDERRLPELREVAGHGGDGDLPAQRAGLQLRRLRRGGERRLRRDDLADRARIRLQALQLDVPAGRVRLPEIDGRLCL